MQHRGLDEHTRHQTAESGPPATSAVSGWHTRAPEDRPVDIKALEADLRESLQEKLRQLPKLYSERPTRPAPPLTGPRQPHTTETESGDATPVRSAAGFIPPPPAVPPPPRVPRQSIAPASPSASVSVRPSAPAGRAGNAAASFEHTMTAALSETRAIRSRFSRMIRGASAFASVVIVLLGILVFQSGSSAAAAQPSPRPKVAAVAVPAAPPAAHAFIEIGLTTSPRSALFRLDDGPWVAGPYTANVPRDDREHEIYVTATGYFPRVVKARFSKDMQFDIVLQKIPDATARWHHPSPR